MATHDPAYGQDSTSEAPSDDERDGKHAYYLSAEKLPLPLPTQKITAARSKITSTSAHSENALPGSPTKRRNAGGALPLTGAGGNPDPSAPFSSAALLLAGCARLRTVLRSSRVLKYP